MIQVQPPDGSTRSNSEFSSDNTRVANDATLPDGLRHPASLNDGTSLYNNGSLHYQHVPPLSSTDSYAEAQYQDDRPLNTDYQQEYSNESNPSWHDHSQDPEGSTRRSLMSYYDHSNESGEISVDEERDSIHESTVRPYRDDARSYIAPEQGLSANDLLYYDFSEAERQRLTPQEVNTKYSVSNDGQRFYDHHRSFIGDWGQQPSQEVRVRPPATSFIARIRRRVRAA